VGMRKDFIMSEEEKQLKRERLEEIRNLSSKRSLTSESTNASSSNILSETLNEIDHVSYLLQKQFFSS